MTTIEYGYVTARLRSMKSHLLDDSFFERLILMKSLTEIIVALEQTTYKKDIHEGVLLAPGIDGVENGLRNNIVNTFTTLRGMVDGQVHRLIDVMLGRWDVQNLKTILRGLHQFAGYDQIVPSLVPAGSINDAALEELSRQEDIRSCLNLMATWSMPYAKPLTENFFHYTEEMNLQALEFGLDSFFFKRSLKYLSRRSTDASLVKEVLMREVDVINMMTVLRLSRDKLPKEKKMGFFLAGGKHIKKALFETMADLDDVDDIIAHLKETPYNEPILRGWEEFIATGRFSKIERSLESFMVGANIRLFRADPLSVAVIIAYIWAKLNEIVNLRIIVRGQVVGMPEEKVREALVFA